MSKKGSSSKANRGSRKRAAETRAKGPIRLVATRPPSQEASLRALKKEKMQLEEELKKQQVLAQDHPTTGNHMADDATDVAEQAKTLALRTHLEGMIREVERAITRIQKGTYGFCERCRRPIGVERLNALPWVTLCIEHAKSAQAPRLKLAA